MFLLQLPYKKSVARFLSLDYQLHLYTNANHVSFNDFLTDVININGIRPTVFLRLTEQSRIRLN